MAHFNLRNPPAIVREYFTCRFLLCVSGGAHTHRYSVSVASQFLSLTSRGYLPMLTRELLIRLELSEL
jgi:hypothetical protein